MGSPAPHLRVMRQGRGEEDGESRGRARGRKGARRERRRWRRRNEVRFVLVKEKDEEAEEDEGGVLSLTCERGARQV